MAPLFIALIRKLIERPLFRNVPEGADADISELPGGSDALIGQVGDVIAGFEHLATSVDAELAD